jgi:predicted ATP-binding protein involved in virulence
MSAGEKKIATLIAGLCDPNYIDDTNIIIVDNVAMHIYFKRHVRMVEKLLELFSDKQFFLATHSGVLIDALDSGSLYDLEDYVKYDKDYAGD